MDSNINIEKKLTELDPQELYNLEKLRELAANKKISLTPKAVGQTLPEAVLIGDSENQQLSKSMVEITERAIDFSVQRDPDNLSNALFPVIGAAIRKALNKLLSDMMQNMNKGLEKTLSMKRLLWRLEARKTGVTFAEIVLRNTLQFRVEHVFLIHTKTGLLLHSISQEGMETADNDMVASMLTVIKNYIQDSLLLKKTEPVDAIAAGNYSLLVEEGPALCLALVVRGVHDGSVRSTMQDTIETLHVRFSKELKKFNGDTDPFIKTEPFLKDCLITRESDSKKRKPIYSIIVVTALLAVIIFAVVSQLILGFKQKDFFKGIDKEQGIMLVSASSHFGKMHIKLLRDPRARDIVSIANEYGFMEKDFTLDEKAFISLDIGPYNVSNTIPEELLKLAKQLGEYTLNFVQDSGELSAGQEIIVSEAGNLISKIIERAKHYGFNVSIEITGHSAGTTQDEKSLSISKDRADKALKLFSEINKHLVDYVIARGVGSAEPLVTPEVTDADRIKNRSVTFKVIFR